MSATQASPVPIPRRHRRRPAQDLSIPTAREYDRLARLVHALEHAAPTGLPLLSLAEESGLDIATTVRTLKRYGDYFLACGDTGKFRLNVFGPFEGDAARIHAHARRKLWRFRWAVLAVVVGLAGSFLLRSLGGG